MSYLLPTFQLVSLGSALAFIVTGLQGIFTPIDFSRSFGIPITADYSSSQKSTTLAHNNATSYVSLMGVRQLATGITLLVFAYQNKWTEMATILSIMGFVVAGTDGFFLWRSGEGGKAMFHVIPGALIASLAAATVLVAG